jgi:hypothetical protein
VALLTPYRDGAFVGRLPPFGAVRDLYDPEQECEGSNNYSERMRSLEMVSRARLWTRLPRAERRFNLAEGRQEILTGLAVVLGLGVLVLAV